QAAVTWLFLRALGLVFLAAFVSLRMQILGLVGSQGLLPAAKRLSAAGQQFTLAERCRALPTLFWLDASDRALSFAATAGIVLAVALILDLAPRLALICPWWVFFSVVLFGHAC